MITRFIAAITLVFVITRLLALIESRDVWATPLNTSPETEIDTVYIVFSCHLDIGFNAHGPLATDKAVINLYFNTHFPNAIKIAQRLRDLGQGQSLSFLTHSYLISLYLDCPQYLDIDCPSQRDVKAFEQAIQRGDIIWHAFPFNGQAEAFYDPGFFSYALQFTHQLDTRFNLTNKITMSQRDVPGLTRSALPILASQGIKALSFGLNAGSAPPDVPHNQLFRWRFYNNNNSNGNDNGIEKEGEMLVFIHPGGYSGVPVDSAEECIKVPALRIALCSSWKQDNEGPPGVDEVVEVYQKVRRTFPSAQKVVSSGFDDFTSQVVAALEDGSLDKDQLPLFEGEIGDSWIGGLASDPGKLAEYLQLLRLRKELLLNADNNGSTVTDFSRALLKIPEHTWGCDSGQAPGDYIHWSNAAFHSMLESNSSKFMDAVTTWWRQRSYNYWAASTLGGEGRGGGGGIGLQALQALWDGWKVPTPDKSNENGDKNNRQKLVWSSDTQHVSTAKDRLVFQNNVWKVQLDLKTGAIIDLTYTDHSTSDNNGQGELSLKSPADIKPSESKWASYNGPLGEIVYSTYAEEDYWIKVWKYYQYNPWFSPDFSKPNSTYHGGAQRRDTTPHLDQVWGKALHSSMIMHNNTDNNTDNNKEEIRITTRALFDEDLVSRAGAPRAIWTEIKSVGDRLMFDVIWEDKTPTRLPEALWLRFRPPAQGPWAVVAPGSWRIWKLGGVIDPGLEVVRNGSMSLHAVSEEGISVDNNDTGSDGGGCQYRMQIQSLDAPLVGVGTPDLFFNVRERPAMEAGVAFNLVNNIWGTNYIMWYPYREKDATMRFRFELTVKKKKDGGGERRGSLVRRSEGMKGALSTVM